MGIQGARVVMHGDPEKVAFFLWHKFAQMGFQRWSEIVLHTHDLVIFEKIEQALCGAFGQGIISFGGVDGDKFREFAIGVFFELKGRPGAGEFPFQEHHFIVPSQGHEVDVLLVPGVVFFANAGGAGFGFGLFFQPADELIGGGNAGLDGFGQFSIGFYPRQIQHGF